MIKIRSLLFALNWKSFWHYLTLCFFYCNSLLLFIYLLHTINHRCKHLKPIPWGWPTSWSCSESSFIPSTSHRLSTTSMPNPSKIPIKSPNLTSSKSSFLYYPSWTSMPLIPMSFFANLPMDGTSFPSKGSWKFTKTSQVKCLLFHHPLANRHLENSNKKDGSKINKEKTQSLNLAFKNYSLTCTRMTQSNCLNNVTKISLANFNRKNSTNFWSALGSRNSKTAKSEGTYWAKFTHTSPQNRSQREILSSFSRSKRCKKHQSLIFMSLPKNSSLFIKSRRKMNPKSKIRSKKLNIIISIQILSKTQLRSPIKICL